MANNKFFTNTYITGRGRSNYLRIDNLEDPLFTSFTFDIDYVTSPLFYTINYSNYGYPTNSGSGIASSIETALSQMYSQNMGGDSGYATMPVICASMIDGYKLGFGLQQSVYMDTPLYGAAEYIYMVDKRNGDGSENGAIFDSSSYVESGGNPNASSGYSDGNSVQNAVNESDEMWDERRNEQLRTQIENCNNILNDSNSDGTGAVDIHAQNKEAVEAAQEEVDFYNTATVDGVEGIFTEEELVKKIKELKEKANEFDTLKKDIIKWANKKISEYQNAVTSSYSGTKSIKRIVTYSDLGMSDDKRKQQYYDELKKLIGNTFVYDTILGKTDSFIIVCRDKYNALVTHVAKEKEHTNSINDDSRSFLLNNKKGDNRATIRQSEIINEFGTRLEAYGLYKKGDTSFEGEVQAIQTNKTPDWLTKLLNGFGAFAKFCISTSKKNDGYSGPGNEDSICDDWAGMTKELMTYQCNDESFVKFESKVVTENKDLVAKFETALNNIRTNLYGTKDGVPRTADNPDDDSVYAKYLEAKEQYENDDYSLAEKMKAEAMSQYTGDISDIEGDNGDSDNGDSDTDNGDSDMGGGNNGDIGGGNNGGTDNGDSDMGGGNIDNDDSNAAGSGGEAMTTNVGSVGSNGNSSVAPRTVLDMLGFISGMKKLTTQYPYIIQGVTGLDNAYNKHYGIKDPYLGSGDDKITLTCLESLDLRVSSMFNRYFNAVYDREYRRERVPINLRRFNCSIYVHDVRNFVSGINFSVENRILEMTSMYYSVIEFRFYDCEIVPEETGNIFDNISNEAPSDMKKTNFTFTYGNCVVNFVPSSSIGL